MRALPGSERAFTIPEVLVAVLVLAAALVPLAALLVQARAAQLENERYVTALFLAQAKLEDLKQAASDAAGAEGGACFPEPYQDYRYSIETEELEAGVQKVVVRVRFAWRGGEKDVVLTSARGVTH